jgi:spermidine/putrescine transport system permease protein
MVEGAQTIAPVGLAPGDAVAQAEAGARRAETRRSWWLNAPALVILALFAAGPLLVMLVYSFLTAGPYGGVVWEPSTDGWYNVLLTADIFTDEVRLQDAHLSIAWRSISLSFLTTVTCLILGFPTAYFIATRSPQNRNLWLFLITVPFWTNLLIRTFAMLEWIRNEGIVNQVLIGFGLIERPLQMLYTDFSIMLGMTYVYFPLMVLPLYAAMEKLDFRLVEAAYDLYATRWRVLRRVIIPLVKPGIIAGSILVFIPSLGAYVTPRVMGGGKNLMLGNLIELQFGQGRNWPLGAALSITLLVAVMVALIFYVRNVQRATVGRG